MSGKVILWRRAGARRADIRRICLTKPQADIAGEMRDAGCESKLQTANCKLQTANCKLQTANCKQDRSMSCVVPPSKRASIGQPNHSKRASRPESLSFAFSSLPVFPSSRLPVFTSSRLHVFTSSRLHVFTSSRLRDIETSRRSNRSRITRAIQLARSFAHSLTSPTLPLLRLSPSLVRARPTRVGRLASPHRVTPSGASAPKPLRHATPHARLSRARGRRRDCARPPSPDRAPDRPPRRSRRYAARTRRPDATPRRRR
ncbi:Uncharacterised protein [Burkholderia pseudomallei]|nr:Uncharacterised protein [Burkholderia pseudomallei]CAJ4643224.1 Uncharacterised protein [Burkholderia pseudomallei]CAJ4833329.1 Uncharacterised protein [Burkholderia pseudomallei]CAJ5030771.1 Uncharacterised protein [Burkholderia pseudomallei]CAJ7020941.1 Uncharacterised protein [Burkholderia pseudomallei]